MTPAPRFPASARFCFALAAFVWLVIIVAVRSALT